MTVGTCSYCGSVDGVPHSENCPEASEATPKDLLCRLIAEWEVEADFLDTPNDADTDRACGRTYRECAKKLRIALGA